MYKRLEGKLYYMPELEGAYEMYLTYNGETYTKWITDSTSLNEEGEALVELVMELQGLPDCKETRDMLYNNLDFEWVERTYVPAHVEQRLIEEESYLVEELSYDY